MDLSLILLVAVMFVMQVNGISPTSRQIADICDLTAGPQCSSDCTKILICASQLKTPMLSVSCTDNKPYCVKGRCVSTPGKCTQIAEESTFVCTSAGVFPDPKDCRKSHFCDEVGSKSVMSLCPKGYIFDSKTKVCGLKTHNSESICQKISCDGVTNNFVSFTANPTFYSYCFTSVTGVEHTYMYKCDDEINKVFDVANKKCRFNCKSIGYNADPLDCSSYYICNGNEFASQRVHCPPNYYFNGTVCLNSKAHCPTGSIVSKPTSSIADNSMADETFTTHKTTSLSTSSSVDESASTPYMYKCDDEINKVFDVANKKCRFNCKSKGYYADPLDCSSYYICNGKGFASRRVRCPANYYFNGTVCLNSQAHCPVGSIVSNITKPTSSIADNSMADETFTTLKTTSLSTSSLADESASTPIADSSLADELTSTPTPTPISDSSFTDEITTAYEPTSNVEVATDTPSMSFSESSTSESFTTHKPVTVEGSLINLTTKKPSIWKHMGLISVRVSRLLNIF